MTLAVNDVDSLPLVLTVEETAKVLRIGRTAAYEAVRRGEVESIAIGRTLRIPRRSVLRLLGERGGDSSHTQVVDQTQREKEKEHITPQSESRSWGRTGDRNRHINSTISE